jgi:hypothetical protein
MLFKADSNRMDRISRIKADQRKEIRDFKFNI